jgi:DNA-directed RNA polymerase subunit RPC12/RpoP
MKKSLIMNLPLLRPYQNREVFEAKGGQPRLLPHGRSGGPEVAVGVPMASGGSACPVCGKRGEPCPLFPAWAMEHKMEYLFENIKPSEEVDPEVYRCARCRTTILV